MKLNILLVSCCLERSRYDVLKKVIENLKKDCPSSWVLDMTVFDNASTWIGLGELRDTFPTVFRADRNVGYWTAIDWWLERLRLNDDQPEYTYIIESDMIHYDAAFMRNCLAFMDQHPEFGGMRLHEYCVENAHLYNKDKPTALSKRWCWQSHTNKVTGEAVTLEHVENVFWKTNFLTQLPALNRYPIMVKVFDRLRMMPNFTELDFQRFYHDENRIIALKDLGMFKCEQQPFDPRTITGSWSSPEDLKRHGYHPTRTAFIVPRDQYTVTEVR